MILDRRGNQLRLFLATLLASLLFVSVPAAWAQDADNDGIGDGIDPCISDALNACYGPVAVDGTTATDIRINTSVGVACSGAKTDCRGEVWNADFGFNQGNSFAGTAAVAGLDAVFGAGCAPSLDTEDILQCERWDNTPVPELIYDFDVPDGDYMVNLLFANMFTGTSTPGSRVFDIVIEGVTVYAGFDQIVASGGDATAVVRAAEVAVSDGNGLQIELIHGVENPAIKGIEVLADTSCSVPADCDDGNVCTDDDCVASSCVNTPNIDPCDDGVACTTSDVCGGGVCVGTDNCPVGESCNLGTGLCQISDAEAFFAITPTGGLTASTFGAGSFQLTNNSPSGQNIVSFSIDLSTAIFTDIVFDPVGAAGDVAGKCFTADAGAAATGLVAPGDPCVSPFFGPHDGGYDGLTIDFTDFNPTELFTFSVDVDPTSIQGGGTTGAAGAVSGLELNGATITVEFDDGSIFTTQTFQTPPASEGGSQNVLKAGEPAAPTIEVLGLTPPQTTATATQTIQVCGPVGETAKLLVVEGELLLTAAPGFDLDPFEANEAVVVQEFTAVIGPSGCVDFNVTLTDSAGADDGLNHLVATILDSDGSGRTGATSPVLVVEFDPTAVDNDNDGFSPPDDCNDNDDTIFPGAPETCDGVDENCDGTVDDGNPGGGAACSTGLLGVCAAGTEQCVAAAIVCVADNSPSAEVCDDADNDCDGATDEDLGQTTCGTGACEVTVDNCVGGVPQTCTPGSPSAEVCDGIDNDCDGGTDEDLGQTTCGTGECEVTVDNCTGGVPQTCTPGSPSAEICDGLDNNCDGTVDDGTSGGACSTGDLGVCDLGTEACVTGVLICTPNSSGSPETCNGLDDDCDGTTDEGNPGGGGSCSTGLPGVCATGTEECTGGLLQCVADSGSPETCNGLDDDCDGTVDDGNPGGGAACSSGEPGICDPGTVQCVGGTTGCVSDITPGDEICATGEDEDCDGAVDEADDCVLCLPENTIALPGMTKRNKVKLISTPSRDKVIAKGTYFQPSPAFSQADEEEVLVRMTDELGVVYEATLPIGSVEERKPGRKWDFKDRTRPFENNGLRQFKLRAKSNQVETKYKVKAQEIDLPAFVGTTSSFTVKIGDTCYFDSLDACSTSTSGTTVKCQ